MTERKPEGVTYETWVDKQIRDAERRGAFDNLEGAGKPIADLDKPHDELWWVKQLMRREQVSVLPPSLALRKEAEVLREHLAQVRSEATVRELVGALNDKIIKALRVPSSGPPLTLMPLDVEQVVRGWREQPSG